MRKKQHKWLVLLVSAMLVCLTPFAVKADAGQESQGQEQEQTRPEEPQDQEPVEPQEPEGLTLEKNGRYTFYENGERIKNQWRTVDGKKYYFQKNGYSTPYSLKIKGKVYVFNSKSQLHQPKKKSIFHSKGYYYYVNPNGTADTGWLVIKGRLYKAYSKSGRFAVNKTENGIRFGKNGAAVKNTASNLKIRSMQIISKITTKKMTKSQKLRACWNYVLRNVRYAAYYPNIWKKGWQQETALYTLTTYGGNCYGFACAFAALAAEVGYTPYVIAGRVPGSRDGASDGMTRHSWVMINGRHYDPEGSWAGWAGYVYGSGYYPMNYTVTRTVNFKTYI